jgi:hypothetical protein
MGGFRPVREVGHPGQVNDRGPSHVPGTAADSEALALARLLTVWE